MEEKWVRGWIEADESAGKLLGRVLTERPLVTLPPPLHRIPVRAGNVVEISGPSPSAKTLLLTQAAVRCILPKRRNGIHYCGLGQVALFIDLDCRFDAARLLQLLRSRIIEATGDGERCDEELISICLRRFLYIRCYDSFEFIATLKTLHDKIEEERISSGARVGLLLIDNVGAFHWPDRAVTASPVEKKSLSLQGVWEVVVDELKKLLLVHPMVIMASKGAVFGTTNDEERHFQGRFSADTKTDIGSAEFKRHKFREYMPSVWRAIVTHRMLVHIPDDYLGNGNHQQVHLLEWLLPALGVMEKFIIRDAGAILAT